MNGEYKIWENCLSAESSEVKAGIGLNKIPEPKKKSLFLQYIEKFKDPLIIILCVILVLSCFVTGYEIHQTHDLKLLFEPVGILLAIILSTGIGFIFEVRANDEFAVLNKVKDENLIKVIRRKTATSKPHMVKVKKCDIVVGDLVRLEGGDEVPADGIIVSDDAVRIDESAYTGEPYTMKSSNPDEGQGEEAYGRNIILRGSIVLEGSCYYKVTAVGADTEEGRGAIKIQEEDDIETPLNVQLDQLGRWLTTGSYIIAGLIFIGRLLYYFFSGNVEDHSTLHLIEYILNSIMIAVTLIVVAVPEGLPMSVTVSLALSMRKMLKENNLVRRLHACETMGATTVICTDKTGTLTKNQMTVLDSELYVSADLLAASIAVNTTAELTEKEDGEVLAIGNPTECALLKWLREKGYDYVSLREQYEVESVIPFSTETKYMETSARNKATGTVLRFVKGAPEILLDRCYSEDSKYNESLESTKQRLDEYQSAARRTLGFAIENVSSGTPLIFVGVVGIADPIRDDVREAVETCSGGAGVRVIMVTGDVAATANEIGKQIGLVRDGSVSITGQEFASMTDEEINAILPRIQILSRAKPDDKARLVSLLQAAGEVVAVTGDGTNDALALKKAQVGLSMGDGTARAKEVSDITILDNSFSSINKAIMWGRSLYMNIRRFIIFQMTINVCACLVVLIGAFTGIDSPLTVTQMLWVNLIMDTFAAMALSSLPADRSVMLEKPRNPKSHIINRKMLRRIVIVGAAFFVFLAGLWQLLWHSDITCVKDLLSIDELKTYFSGFFDMSRTKPHMSHYESGVFFTTFVVLQFWNLFNTRYFNTGHSLLSDMIGICRGKRRASECFSSGFVLISLVILLGQVIIVNFAGSFFDVSPLSLADWCWILLLTSPILIIPDLFRSLKTMKG